MMHDSDDDTRIIGEEVVDVFILVVIPFARCALGILYHLSCNLECGLQNARVRCSRGAFLELDIQVCSI
jgi:hypothetical protein